MGDLADVPEPPDETGEQAQNLDEYKYLVLVDNSEDENGAGTPGSDICGVQVVCGEEAMTGDEAWLYQGAGYMCDEIGQNCATARNMPISALDAGDSCEPESSPISDYVSVGIGGILALEFAQDLQGCSVRINEHQGQDREGFEVYVCKDATMSDCLGDTPVFESRFGGEVTGEVEAAPEASEQ